MATALWIVGITTLLYLTEQRDFPVILTGFSMAFTGYVIMANSRMVIKWIIVLAVLLRLVSFGSLPQLSDDVYRFIWDGRLLSLGVSPFHTTPNETRELISDDLLYDRLNSKDYHSVYPVIAQTGFYLSTAWGQSHWWSVLILRLFIGIFEMGLIWQMLKWFKRFQIPDHRLAWYVFNPLVIVETYGNLHFEVVMAFFVMMTLNYWSKPLTSAAHFALSVASKALSLILLPFFFLARKPRHRWPFLISVLLLTSFLFIPVFYNPRDSGFWQSINLYFQTFEFNAGVYYVMRSAGYMLKGYNLIGIIGPALAAMSAVMLIGISFYHRKTEEVNFPMVIMLLFTTYLLLATTLHPWYIITPLIFGIMAGYRYIIIWSFVVTFSYHAYAADPVSEKVLWILLEYVTLTAALIYDLIIRPPHRSTDRAV